MVMYDSSDTRRWVIHTSITENGIQAKEWSLYDRKNINVGSCWCSMLLCNWYREICTWRCVRKHDKMCTLSA